MEFKNDKVYDTVLLSQKDSLFDLCHETIEKPKLKNYIVINEHVIHITPDSSRMTQSRLFKKKENIF